MMMIKKSEQPNKCRYSLMYRGFSVRKKVNNAAQSSYKIRTEIMEDMTEGQLADYLVENFNDY